MFRNLTTPTATFALALLVALAVAPAGAADNAAEKRQSIDAMAEETLAELFRESSSAEKLYEEAYGYAVFSNLKFQFIVAGGGGKGVAVNKATGKRTYMNMGTGGVGLGIGGKKSSIVFLFEDERAFRRFVDNGWQADTQAGVAAGKAAADVESNFHNGLKYYQITKKGLIASADVSGTRYWEDDDLNG